MLRTLRRASRPAAGAVAGRRVGRRRPSASAPPKRFLASCSALRLASSSWRRRSSSSRLARLGGLALGLLAAFALVAAACFFLGDLALFGLAHLGVGQRVGARRCALPRSACAARRPDGFGAGCGGGAAAAAGAAGGGAAPPAGAASARPQRAAAQPARACASPAVIAALHLLDHHRLGAAMAEALAHRALLDAAALQRQGLVRGDASTSCRRGSSYRSFRSQSWGTRAFGCCRRPVVPRRPASPVR